MRIRNSAAAKRAGVTVRTLARWDTQRDKVGYAKPIHVCGRIYRDTDEIEQFERNNPNFSPVRKSARSTPTR